MPSVARRLFCIAFVIAASASAAVQAAEPRVELLWPKGAPDAAGTDEGDKPTLTIWQPAPEKTNGCAVVVCPGGGYHHLAVGHEGEEVAKWLNTLGVTAFMLKYRIAPRYKHPAPLQDAQRAIRTVRARAAEWKVDPQRIGIMGFSAGGHLTSTAATHFDNGNPGSPDAIEKASCRPDFAILCYPVISLTTPYVHAGSRDNLLGKNPDEKLLQSVSNELQVTDKTPPTFLFHTNADEGVVPENSVLFYMALRKAKVPAELHIYEKGAHGVGLAKDDPILSTWSGRLADWMKGRGLLNMPKIVADNPEAVTDPDFAVQGEYVGEIMTDDGAKKIGVQVIARGNGKFTAVGYVGGLPGDGWQGPENKYSSDGERKNGVVTIGVVEIAGATIKDGQFTITTVGGTVMGQLKKVLRQSPTLGAKPPEGAIVLFDGKSADPFEGGRVTPDGLLMQGVTSKRKFQSGTLHLEFRTPYMPQDSGQARGNSGCYLQGRFEVQILDSFGLEGKDNEAGGIYSVSNPLLNMCFPPLTWQTYDIDFTAAEYDAAGKVTKNARMTVRHNGVVVQNNVEVAKKTTAAPLDVGPEPGPIYLQDHGNPVRFRNIWFVEKK